MITAFDPDAWIHLVQYLARPWMLLCRRSVSTRVFFQLSLSIFRWPSEEREQLCSHCSASVRLKLLIYF